MTLTLQEVEHIANLARLELSPAELALYREQLSAILDHFSQLQQLDTGGVLPYSEARRESMSLRPDQARPGLSTEALLRNAPATEDNQFRVPPVLD
jgi:aspartyl-tRNA(Asn)/glutamyl-tRNA(Gln) amidotransferase subunit C